MITIGILLFHEVEVLDFAGPFEIFSLAEEKDKKLCSVITISEKEEIISARNGLKVVADYTCLNHPELDILIVPGGYGAEEVEIKNRAILDWIKGQRSKVRYLASVCTGAFLLAESGLLDGLEVTTHHLDQERLQKDYPKLKVLSNQKFVDQGDILTSGGISAGMNLSFFLLEKLFSRSVAIETAERMEYDNY